MHGYRSAVDKSSIAFIVCHISVTLFINIILMLSSKIYMFGDKKFGKLLGIEIQYKVNSEVIIAIM